MIGLYTSGLAAEEYVKVWLEGTSRILSQLAKLMAAGIVCEHGAGYDSTKNMQQS